MIAIVDGDLIAYQVGFASDIISYTVEGVTSPFKYKKDALDYLERHQLSIDKLTKHHEWEPLEFCLHSVKKTMEKITTAVEATEVITFVSSEGETFREALDPNYKANRDSKHKPHWFPEIKEYLFRSWGGELSPTGLEADDAMAIFQMSHFGTTLLCTQDKDLNMIPGRHFNWRTESFQDISEEEALRFFWRQMITGDSADNIKGIWGLGPKRSEAILAECKTTREMHNRVLELYGNKVQNGEEVFVQNAQLLWIWRKNPDSWAEYVRS
jgi:5'-3' exonuclease